MLNWLLSAAKKSIAHISDIWNATFSFGIRDHSDRMMRPFKYVMRLENLCGQKTQLQKQEKSWPSFFSPVRIPAEIHRLTEKNGLNRHLNILKWYVDDSVSPISIQNKKIIHWFSQHQRLDSWSGTNLNYWKLKIVLIFQLQ